MGRPEEWPMPPLASLRVAPESAQRSLSIPERRLQLRLEAPETGRHQRPQRFDRQIVRRNRLSMALQRQRMART